MIAGWLLVGVAIVYCRCELNESKYERLQVGMTCEEVRAIIDRPDSKHRPHLDSTIQDGEIIRHNEHLSLVIRKGRLVEKGWK